MDLDALFRECYFQGPPTILHDFCEGVWMTTDYLEVKEAIHNFKVRDDDVWLCAMPRSGTNWTKAMIWSIANDANSEQAKNDVMMRFPGLEGRYVCRCNCILRRLNKPVPSLSIEQIEQMLSPRFIKTHLPYHLLPKQLTEQKTDAKIIYVSRNPKDNCISAYHFYQYVELYCGTFEQFCELYLGDRVAYAPFWKHIAGYWEHKDSKNLLLLKYEDMKKDLPSAIRKIASFLNKSLSDEQVRVLEDHLSFKNMKSNAAVNFEQQLEVFKQCIPWSQIGPMQPLIRKGEVNQWKTEMSDDLRKKFDVWIKKNLNEYPQLKNEFSYFI